MENQAILKLIESKPQKVKPPKKEKDSPQKEKLTEETKEKLIKAEID